MRKLLLLASLLICLMSVNALAQEAPSAQKTTSETEQPKNAVDRAVDEAREHGEKVMGTCLMDCGEAAPITEGVETGHAIELPKPAYPPIARAAHAQGTVGVQVIIGLDGSVIVAAAISGHPLLQAAAAGREASALYPHEVQRRTGEDRWCDPVQVRRSVAGPSKGTKT